MNRRLAQLKAQYLRRCLVLGLSCPLAVAFTDLSASTANAQVAAHPTAATATAGGPAASAPVPPTRSNRITPADLEDTLVLIGELDERMKLAELKLEPDSLDRKNEIGKLRGLLAAVDQQIRVVSSSIQRKEEKLNQLRQEVLAVGADEAKVLEANAAFERMAQRIKGPLEIERARLEKLGRQRTLGQQKISRLQEELVLKLMQASDSPTTERGSSATALDSLLDEELSDTSAPKPKQ